MQSRLGCGDGKNGSAPGLGAIRDQDGGPAGEWAHWDFAITYPCPMSSIREGGGPSSLPKQE